MEVAELRRILRESDNDESRAHELLSAAGGATQRELVIAFKVALGSPMLDARRAQGLLRALELAGSEPSLAPEDPDGAELRRGVEALRAQLDALGQTRAGLVSLQEVVRRLEAEARMGREALEEAGSEVRRLEEEARRLAALEKEFGA